MIKVNINKNKIVITGHAEYADYGKDIVCASVSSIVITSINAALRIDNKFLTYEENDNLTPRYLEILADYLVLCMEKQERKERKILTENRMMTVNKRETSFEGLASQLENGEDGIYNLITDNKHTIF